MKVIRSAVDEPNEPSSSPQKSELVLSIDPKAILSVIAALADARKPADVAPAPAPAAPEKPAEAAAPKPSARANGFTVSITKRDSRGRALEFDVRPKTEDNPEELDPFEQGYSSVQPQ
jgi:hypothetical protein